MATAARPSRWRRLLARVLLAALPLYSVGVLLAHWAGPLHEHGPTQTLHDFRRIVAGDQAVAHAHDTLARHHHAADLPYSLVGPDGSDAPLAAAAVVAGLAPAPDWAWQPPQASCAHVLPATLPRPASTDPEPALPPPRRSPQAVA